MIDAVEREVISIIGRRSGRSPAELNGETRFVEDLGLDGDDAVDAIIEVCRIYNMDTSKFEAESYFRSEPNIFSIFRRRPRDQKQSFTIGKLVDAVAQGSLE